MEIISDIFEQVAKLGPELLTAAVCIVIGYVMRCIPAINNKLIPAICTFLGGVVYPIISKPQSVSPDIKNPIVAMVIIGLVIGFVAWTFHNAVLSKLEDKIPVLKNLLGAGNPKSNENKTDNPTPGGPQQPVV